MIDHHVRTIERAADDRNVLGVVGFTATRRGPREDRPRAARAELVVTPAITETVRSDRATPT